jgi:type II secretory pathway component PulF
MQLWVVGEETGSLDQDLERWSRDAERDAHARSAQAVDLTIKAASALVALLLGWRIISAYQQIIDGYLELIP